VKTKKKEVIKETIESSNSGMPAEKQEPVANMMSSLQSPPPPADNEVKAKETIQTFPTSNPHVTYKSHPKQLSPPV